MKANTTNSKTASVLRVLSIFDNASEPDKSVTAKEVFVYHLFIFSDISLLLIHSLYAILTYLIWPYANGLFYYLGHLTHLLPYQTLVQYENRQSPDWLQLLATSYTSCSLYLSQFLCKTTYTFGIVFHLSFFGDNLSFYQRGGYMLFLTIVGLICSLICSLFLFYLPFTVVCVMLWMFSR